MLVALNAAILFVLVIFLGAIVLRLSYLESQVVDVSDTATALKETVVELEERELVMECSNEAQVFGSFVSTNTKWVCREQR